MQVPTFCVTASVVSPGTSRPSWLADVPLKVTPYCLTELHGTTSAVLAH